MGHVDSSQVAPLYANTTPGLTADANVFDPAIAALIVAINENFDSFEAFKASIELPIPDQSIVTRHLRNLAVTNPKLAPLAVTADKIADGTITTAKLIDMVVTSQKVTDFAIIEQKLSNASVSRRTIIAGAVGINELDPSLIAPISDAGVQAKFNIVDERFYDSVINIKFPPPPLVAVTGNSITDDTSAINGCASAARSRKCALFIPSTIYDYRVTATLDLTDLYVYGMGVGSKVQASNAQFDVIKSEGNTTLENFYVDGGWDGFTAALSGDTIYIRNAVTNTPFNVHLKEMRIQNSKSRAVYIERGGYSSIESCKINVCGLHAIELYGPNGSQAITTINIYGQTTASDCPYGYGLKVTNGVNISLNNVIIEYTKGIELSGNDNRSLSFNVVYQENTSGGKYLTLTGSGQGLSVTNSFGGGSSIPYSPNWLDVHFSGNSSLTESAIPFNNRVLSADGGEVTTATTGNFTPVSISLPPGAWKIYAALQTQDASGGASVGELAAQLTLNSTAPGKNIATNSNFEFGQSCLTYSPPSQANLRVNLFKFYINTTNANETIYLRGYVNITAGTIAYKGQIYAERLQ